MRLFRHLILVIVVLAVVLSTVWTVFAFSVRDRYVVPILMYHRVGDSPSNSIYHQGVHHESLNAVSVKVFDRQMAYLKNNGYTVISLADLVEGFHKSRMFDRKTAVITFDDGYKDNYTNAFPILKKYDLPATVFVISDSVGTADFMTWEQLKEIDKAGFKVGSHTRRHAYLPDLGGDISRLEDEIINSKKILEEKLGQPVLFFSYPSGGFGDSIKEVIKKAGYVGACATNRGYDRFNRDVYELKRIRINGDDIDIVLFMKLSGYYNLLRKSKSPY